MFAVTRLSTSNLAAVMILFMATNLIVVSAQKPATKPPARPQEKRGLGIKPTLPPVETRTSETSTDKKPELVLQTGHSSSVAGLVFSADGRLLATASLDKTVRIWECATGRELRALTGHAESVQQVTFSADGQRLASASDREVKVWDVATGEAIRSFDSRFMVTAIAFTADGRSLVASQMTPPQSDYGATIWDVVGGNVVRTLGNALKSATSIFFSPDGKLMASGHVNYVGALRSESVMITGMGADIWRMHSNVGSAIAMSGDGRLLAAAGREGILKLFELPSGNEIRSWKGSAGDVEQLALSFDGRHLAARTFGEKVVRVWDTSTGQAVREIPAITSEMACSRDFRRLAVADRGEPGVTILELDSGVEVQKLASRVRPPGVVVVSPDGRWLATASGFQPGKISIWELATGRPIHTLIGHSTIEALAFTPDGQRLASAGMDTRSETRGNFVVPGQIRLWDVFSGRQVSALTGHGMGAINALAFSRDGRMLASAGSDGIRLWEARSGQLLKTLAPGFTRAVSLAFSNDAQRLVWATANGIEMWDLATDRTVPTRFKPFASVRPLKAVTFSADGRWLAAGNETEVKIWEAETGNEIQSWSTQGTVDGLAFTPGGKSLAYTNGNSVTLWDLTAPRASRDLAAHEREQVKAVAVSPDGRLLATGSSRSTVKMWDATSGREVASLVGHKYGVDSVGFSPDGRLLVSSGSGDALKLWAVESQKELLSLPAARVFAFSPDGRLLAAEYGRTVVIREGATGKEIRTIQAHTEGLWSVAFSPDGRVLATGGGGKRGDSTVRLWSVETGARLHSLEGHTDTIFSLAFSPDGRRLASGGLDHSIKIWDPTSGRHQLTLSGHTSDVKTLAFSPDGRFLASGGSDGMVKLWNPGTGQEIETLFKSVGALQSIAFGPEGRWLATGGGVGSIRTSPAEQLIKLWDTTSGRERRTLMGHTGRVLDLGLSPSGKLLASISSDGSTRLWDTETGEELAVLLSLANGTDWMVVTPDGLFDGSAAAWNHMLWRFGNTFDVAPVEAFFNEFYYPDLLARIFAGERPKAPRDIGRVDRRQPALKLALAEEHASTAGAFATRYAKVRIEVAEAPPDASRNTGSGARDVRLFRNGSLVKLWRGDVLKDKAGKAILEASVPIVSGENRLTAYAFNQDNIKSSDAALTISGAESLKRKGIAYILAIGVNQYSNNKYNLKYAVADAQDFAAEMERQQAKLNQYERVEIIALNDGSATKAAILKSLADIAGKTQPEDAVIIYFAGHGTAHGNRFYLIPHDLGYLGSRILSPAGLKNILEHSISDEELERAVEGIDAGQLLMVIDACNSGQALEAEEKRRGPMNSKGLAQLAYEKGMYILTAAQSYQAALEAVRLGHGYLTYALVEEGLKTNVSDRAPKDGQVLVREWLDFATARVPEMQLEKIEEQRKDGRQLEQLIKFAESDGGTDRNLQRPRVFYRREVDSSPLIVAKP